MTEVPDFYIPQPVPAPENDSGEQGFNHAVLQLTQTARNILGKKLVGLSAGAGITILAVNSTPLLSVTARYIRIAALKDVGQLKTRAALPTIKPVDQGAFQAAIKMLSPHIIRLNKLGISYVSADIELEASCLKKLKIKEGIHLYEETSGNPRERWLSMGSTDNWQDPLLEIVLSKKNGSHELRPAFLMDFDTTLSFEQLRALMDPIYGADFFQWKLDAPDIGTVLAIGKIGDINGRKINLGFGTNLRNTERHRQHLQLIK